MYTIVVVFFLFCYLPPSLNSIFNSTLYLEFPQGKAVLFCLCMCHHNINNTNNKTRTLYKFIHFIHKQP